MRDHDDDHDATADHEHDFGALAGRPHYHVHDSIVILDDDCPRDTVYFLASAPEPELRGWTFSDDWCAHYGD